MAEPLRTNTALVFALWAAGLGSAAQFGKISVPFDRLALIYDTSGALIGAMVSVVGLVGLVFGTTAGLLVQRLGPRRVLLGAMAAGAAISLFQALLPAYPVMIASRILEGGSHLAIVVAAPTLMAQVTALRHQAMAMTLWSSFFGVSFAATSWLGLPLVAAHGPAALFVVHAGFLALVAVWLAALLPRDGPRHPDPLRLSDLLRQHVVIYASPRIPAAAFGFVFYTLIFVAVLTLLPQMVVPELRLQVATAMPLASIAASFTLGVWLLRIMSAVGLVQIGLALSALAAGALWLVWGQGTAVLVAAVALAATLGLVQGGSFNVIPQLNASPDHRAQAAGAVAQLGNLGTSAGTPILALMSGVWGMTGVLVFAVPLCMAGILVHAWLSWRRG